MTAQWLLDGDGRVRRLLDGDRMRDSAIATAMVMDCDDSGDGQ